MKLLLVLTALVCSFTIFAQPSDATVKTKALSDGSTFVEFVGEGRVHNSLTEIWYVRVVVTKKASEVEGVDRISGKEYSYTKSGGSWKYQKTSIWYTEYEGIPNPTEAEAVAFVKTDIQEFLGGSYTDVVGEVESIALAEEPRWQWVSMTSVSFNMNAVYNLKVSSTELSKVKQDYKVTFNSNEVKGQWTAFRTSNIGRRETISTETYTADELRAIPTLNEVLYEKEVQASFDALPKVDIPIFSNEREMIMYTHKMLRELSREEMNYYLVKTAAPSNFYENSEIALNQSGQGLVNGALEEAFQDKTSYATQFCEHPSIKHVQDNMMELWNKEESRHCRIAVQKIDGIYKISALSIYVLSKTEDYTRIEAANKCGEPYAEAVIEIFEIGEVIKTVVRGEWKNGKISKKDNAFENRYYVNYDGGGGAWLNSDQMEKGSNEVVAEEAAFKIGDKVTTQMRGKTYNGVVTKQDGDNPRFYVELEGTGAQWINADGLTKSKASGSESEKEMASQTFETGDKVMGNWKGQGKWYPGIIQAKIGKKYVVFYDDGDKETTTADKLKMK